MTPTESAAIAAAPAPRPGSEIGWIALIIAALVGGLAVAWLSRFGLLVQSALIVGMATGPAALLLFVLRPNTALAVYLFVLPLIVSVPIVGGLNGGEILSLLVVIVGMLTLWQSGDRILPSAARLGPILLPIAGLVAVSMISLLVNGILRFEEVASAVLKYVAFAIVPFLVHVHLRDAQQARNTLVALLLGGGGVAVYALVSYLAGWTYSAEYDWNRPMGTFENWNLLGACMALMAPPTLGFAVARTGMTRVLFALLFALEIVVMLLSLTLGSMLGIVVAAVVLVFLVRPRMSSVLAIITLAVLAAGIGYSTAPALREKVEQFDERMTDRLRTYATGAMMFRDKFWWGFGSEQNMAVEIMGGEADYALTRFGGSPVVPHNAFLKVSAEKGVFGLLTFTAAVLGSLFVLFRVRRNYAGTRDEVVYYGIVGGLLAFLVQNMTNDLLQHARLGILFFAMLAAVDRMAPRPRA